MSSRPASTPNSPSTAPRRSTIRTPISRRAIFPEGFKAVDIYLWDGAPNWAWVGTEFKQKNNLVQIGGFLQDTWSPMKRVTVNLGVRYDFSQGNYPPQKKRNSDEWINQNTIHAMSFNMLSPRLGMSFDPFGDGKTVLRTNFGRYYAPLLMIYYYFNNPNQRSSFWAQLEPRLVGESRRPRLARRERPTVDPDISSPFADEFNFGIERELFENFSAVGHLSSPSGKRTSSTTSTAATSIGTITWTTGELVWTGYSTGHRHRSLHRRRRHLLRDGRRLRGLRLRSSRTCPARPASTAASSSRLTKRMSDRWAMQASYVWSRGRASSTPPATRARVSPASTTIRTS